MRAFAGRGRVYHVAVLIFLALVVAGSLSVLPAGAVDSMACRSPDVRVNNGTTNGFEWEPSLAVGPQGTAYAVWADPRDEPDGAFSLYFSRSVDAGRTWSAPDVRVNPFSLAHQGGGRIVSDAGGALYAIWRGGTSSVIDVWTSRSDDGGATWSQPSKVNDVSGFVQVSRSYGPAIAVAGDGTLYAAWEDWRNGDPDVYAAQSTDGGATWGMNVKVHDDPVGTAQRGVPGLAVDPEGVVYVAWTESMPSAFDADVYAAASSDGGRTWGAKVRVNAVAPGWQMDAALAADATTVYAAWYENRGDRGDIYSARSWDRGLTWDAAVRVNRRDGNIEGTVPALAVERGRVYVAWHEFLAGEGARVVLARSSDGGGSWDSEGGVSASPSAQRSPALALGPSGTVYVAWVDERNGHTDIYSTACTFADPLADVTAGPTAGPGRPSVSASDPGIRAPGHAYKGLLVGAGDATGDASAGIPDGSTTATPSAGGSVSRCPAVVVLSILVIPTALALLLARRRR